MKQSEAAGVMERVFDACRLLRNAGQKEYAHEDDNAFRNFEAVGKYLGIPREKVLLVYAIKHLDGVTAFVNGHRSQREPVQGRIQDLIVYLCLLYAMIEEDTQPVQIPSI